MGKSLLQLSFESDLKVKLTGCSDRNIQHIRVRNEKKLDMSPKRLVFYKTSFIFVQTLQ